MGVRDKCTARTKLSRAAPTGPFKSSGWPVLGHTEWARDQCQLHDGATAVKQRH